MSEKYQVTDRFLRLHPHLFQKTLVLAAIRSRKFYLQMKTRLCPVEEVRQGRRPDFHSLEFNKIYGLIADYWDMMEPTLNPDQDYQMGFNDVEEMLLSEINGSRLTTADAEKLSDSMKVDMELFEFTPDALARMHLNPLIDGWLQKRAATNLIELAFNRRAIKPMTLDELVQHANAVQASLVGDSRKVVRGADLIFGTNVSNIPFFTDLPLVNDATGGGLRPKTTTLVAGINGGGKTILAMQWAKHYALNGANVVVFTTEQPPDQLITRMICNHLQIGFERFTNVGVTSTMPLGERRHSLQKFSVLPEDVLREHYDKIVEFYHQIWPRLFFVDWSSAPMAVYKDFEAEMARIVATGWDPDVVIFDWIGGGIDNPRDVSSMDIRLLYKEAIETLIAHGKRTSRVMIAMAQLNKTNVGPQKKAVMMSDLAECKSMTDNVTVFVGISALREKPDSTKDENRLKSTLLLKQYLNLDKSRFGIGGLVPVEAAFRIQAFRPWTGASKHL
jgi:KaiC/GvpD/RAD55 family RecA-like ATPase